MKSIKIKDLFVKIIYGDKYVKFFNHINMIENELGLQASSITCNPEKMMFIFTRLFTTSLILNNIHCLELTVDLILHWNKNMGKEYHLNIDDVLVKAVKS